MTQCRYKYYMYFTVCMASTFLLFIIYFSLIVTHFNLSNFHIAVSQGKWKWVIEIMNEDWYTHGVNELKLILSWATGRSNLRKCQYLKMHSYTCKRILHKSPLLLISEYRAFQHAFSDPYIFSLIYTYRYMYMYA